MLPKNKLSAEILGIS